MYLYILIPDGNFHKKMYVYRATMNQLTNITKGLYQPGPHEEDFEILYKVHVAHELTLKS